MYSVYALRSLQRNYIYVGLTEDLDRRIHQHNTGLSSTTRPYAPFILIYSTNFPTRAEARHKEKYLKSGIGKEFLRGLKY
jgi:putative endonuclease